MTGGHMSAERKLEESYDQESHAVEERSSKHIGPPAPKLKRIFAALIDTLFCTGLNLAIIYAFNMAGLPYGAIISGVFLLGAYYVFPTYSYGQTLGKKLLGIMVVPMDAEQEYHSFAFIALRESIFKYISAIPLGIGYLWFFFQKENRTWHDFLGKTIVVEVE